jgi:hypothetical protein
MPTAGRCLSSQGKTSGAPGVCRQSRIRSPMMAKSETTDTPDWRSWAFVMSRIWGLGF